MPSRVIAASFALIAFATAIAAGVSAGNTAETIVWRALLAMWCCYFVGLMIGAAAHRVLREHIEQYKQSHPVIDPESAGESAADSSPDPPGAAGAPAQPANRSNPAARSQNREAA